MRALTEYLARLAPRERLILVAGGFLGVILLVWALALVPLTDGVKELEALTERKRDAVGELAGLVEEYQRQAARIGGAVPKQADRNFSLLSFLEGLSARSNVKGNINYMRPTTTDVAEGIREHAVEIKVTNIPLGAMVELLTAVERSPHALRVKRLHVKRRFSDASLLDVTFVVSRYEEI
ncbi:MAG: type II secretion system protein M [Nitrospirae bacterium]|nr:type II secretion system protein M [Nitrospirota bacterium]